MNMEYAGSESLSVNTDTPPGSIPLERIAGHIKADKLIFLIWDVKDLDKQASFLLDFGMKLHEKNEQNIYMRGFGDEPYLYYGRKAKKTAFKGIGFAASSRHDLEILAEKTGKRIEKINLDYFQTKKIIYVPNPYNHKDS